MKGLLIFVLIMFFLYGGDYYGGDGVVEVKKGEWISGVKSNLNVNDSLYFVVSNIGGIKSPRILGAVPKPMDGNSPGLWGVTFVNPTGSPITITQVDIIQPNAYLLFNGVSGIKPGTGWSLINQSNVRWSGSIIVPAHSGYDFICSISGTGNNFVNCAIRLTATTSSGVFANDSFTTTSGPSFPCVSASFVKGVLAYYLSDIYSNTNNQYRLRFLESSGSIPVDSGTNLTINIPPKFMNVIPSTNPDFSNPTVSYDSITGWTISTSLLHSLLNDSVFYNFAAISPLVGGNSLYPFNISFGQAQTQGIVQVVPPPASGDSGQINNVSLFIVCPNPMDRNTYGVWGGILVNPTQNTILVNRFEITSPPGTNLFNNVLGVKPASGWTRVNFNTIRWSGSLYLPPRSGVEFFCRIKGNNRNVANAQITFTAYTNQGNYSAQGLTNQSRSGIPYANLYYLVAGSPTGLIAGINSGGLKTFVVRVAETGKVAIPSGTTLRINIPPKWANVTASGNQSGFNTPTITGDSINGWTITTTTNVGIQNSFRDFQFSARAPTVAINAYYLFPTYLINTSSTPNIYSVCEAIAEVLNPTGGLIIQHTSPGFLEPGYTISTIDMNLIQRASIPEFCYLSIYNFNNSQWENLIVGAVDTIENSFTTSVSANISRYLNASNQILITNATNNTKIHSLLEDFLLYRVYNYSVSGIDLAPSVVNRGQDSVVMLRLFFNSGSGSYGINQVRIYLSGTGVNTDITAVKLFDDLNHNGYLEPGEPQVGTTQIFTAGVATFTGNPLFTFSNVLPKSILIVYTISNTAGLGSYVGVDIMSSNDILTNTNMPVPGIYPISSSQAQVSQGAPIIHWAYARPETIVPNNLDITKIRAKVTDPQGLGDIRSVRIDCQPIGGDSIVLLYDDGTHGDSIPMDSIFTRDSIRAGLGTMPGDYYLKIEAIDLADTCARSFLHLFIKDIVPPLFLTYTLSDTSYIGPFVVKSEITDFSGIAADSLYYKVNQGSFYQRTRDSISGGLYYFTIPTQSVGCTIYYYLSATDNHSNRGTDPQNVPDSIYRFVIRDYVGVWESKLQSPKIDFKIVPNPARDRVAFCFDCPLAANARLKIYDVSGRIVKQLHNLSVQAQLSRQFIWDGCDNQNRPVAQGVYFVVYEQPDNSQMSEQRIIKKMVFIR